MECRICCQEEPIDEICEPCACQGTLKYAHHSCVQKWVTVSGTQTDRSTCEVCNAKWKISVSVPTTKTEEEKMAETSQRLFQVCCSAYLRLTVGIPRENDAYMLERLGTIFEYSPGTTSLTPWAKDRVKKEKSFLFRCEKVWGDMKSKLKGKNQQEGTSSSG